MQDDDARASGGAAAHRVGEPLDTLSVEELERRIAALRDEIERLDGARREKLAARERAGALFRS